MANAFRFRCQTCHKEHEGAPSFGPLAPFNYERLSAADREARAVLSPDQCIIRTSGERGAPDAKYEFYIRGELLIPVHGSDPFVWLVWVSLSEASHERMGERWEVEGREHDSPYSGWLSSYLSYEPTTLNLETRVHTRPVGLRPLIELEPTDHPLAVEQREGLTLAQFEAKVTRLLHSS